MKILTIIFYLSFTSCSEQTNNSNVVLDSVKMDTLETVTEDTHHNHVVTKGLVTDNKHINTGNTKPGELLDYAKSLIGTPYRYGSVNPKVGFDCSGFITHVFNHFNIAVPRSSIDFTHVEKQINVEEAKAGDIVLFTGTNNAIRDVGHMGIVTGKTNDEIHFIHCTSGKAYGVTITPLNKYYMGRFVKVIRIFEQNDN
jgi:cell wall-associated NlpC family hydrolase